MASNFGSHAQITHFVLITWSCISRFWWQSRTQHASNYLLTDKKTINVLHSKHSSSQTTNCITTGPTNPTIWQRPQVCYGVQNYGTVFSWGQFSETAKSIELRLVARLYLDQLKNSLCTPTDLLAKCRRRGVVQRSREGNKGKERRKWEEKKHEMTWYLPHLNSNFKRL